MSTNDETTIGDLMVEMRDMLAPLDDILKELREIKEILKQQN